MIDFIKKIGWIFFGLIVAAIAFFSLYLCFGGIAEVVVKIVKIAGGGSLFKGFIMAPFFIFGVVQIFRGACKIFDSDLKKMDTSNDSFWHWLYIPATIIGYIAVILAIGFWSSAA